MEMVRLVSLSDVNNAKSRYGAFLLLVFCSGGIPLNSLHIPCRCPHGHKE